jgi:hypothetical protein
MEFNTTFLIVITIAAIPVPLLLIGESIAIRLPNSKFTTWWRKHIMADYND